MKIHLTNNRKSVSTSANSFLQKKAFNNHAYNQPLPIFLQPKLTIGAPDDIYEKEADAMADKVMRMQMPEPINFSSGKKSVQRKCEHCEEEEKQLQKKESSSDSTSVAPPIVHDVINSSYGKPLDWGTRSFMEPRFNYNFSNVKIHDDNKAAESAGFINALAYTSGNNVVFNSGQYNTNSDAGKRLLAHELTHVVQQKNKAGIQRSPGVTINSPVADELITQVSDVHGMLDGRSLYRHEVALVQQVFQNSVDYSRVRIIITGIAAGTTAGNNIRLPQEFSMNSSYWREVLVHEMTHVWQYQHFGSGYITTSLFQQLHAGITKGSRNFAYAYTIDANKSFFDYHPEQQALIVENYFSMLRDRNQIAGLSAGVTNLYDSNYFGADGFKSQLNGADRMAQILAELPQHQIWIDQMRATPYLSVLDLAAQRSTNVMIRMPGSQYLPPPTDRMPDSVPSFFRITF